jgi:hypothetical protein
VEIGSGVMLMMVYRLATTVDNIQVFVRSAPGRLLFEKWYILHCGSNAFMESVRESLPEVSDRNRIWFFPDKFWRATKGMSPEEVSALMQEVEAYAAAGDVQALKKYPFVFVGDPYKRRKTKPAA